MDALKVLERLKLGRIKLLIERQLRYIALLNFFMLAHMYIQDAGWHWWYLLTIPVFCITLWLDAKFILPSEISYVHSKSSVMDELRGKNGHVHQEQTS